MNEEKKMYTESQAKLMAVKAKGAMLADIFTEIQAAESRLHCGQNLCWPDLKLSTMNQDQIIGSQRILSWLRVHFDSEYRGETHRESRRLINRANSTAFALAQVANALIELAQEDEDERTM